VHRLPGHPIPASDLSHRGPIQDLKDRPIPLLGHAQLHQHRSPLLDRDQKDHGEKSHRTKRSSVTHLPELLSPTYRNRVPKLSPKNRNRRVHHEPDSHTPVPPRDADRRDVWGQPPTHG